MQPPRWRDPGLRPLGEGGASEGAWRRENGGSRLPRVAGCGSLGRTTNTVMGTRLRCARCFGAGTLVVVTTNFRGGSTALAGADGNTWRFAGRPLVDRGTPHPPESANARAPPRPSFFRHFLTWS